MRPIKSEECNCCMFETTELTFYKPQTGGIDQEGRWLCELCASTMTSHWDDYSFRRRDSGDVIEVMKTICYVGNKILSELKKKD